MATAANTVYKLQKTQYVVANNTMIQNADMIIRGNLTIIGGQTYANSQTLLVRDNIITLNAAINQSGIPTMDAGIEIDRGSEQNVALMWKESESAWKFTNDGVNYETLGGGSAGSYANSAFLQANSAYNAANNALDTWVRNQANSAYNHANASYNVANSSVAWSTRQAFVATAGQTSFSSGSGYLVGYIDVYYNGIKLYGGEDYTATDGINVTLTNPATVNSIIEIVGFGANVPVNNVYVLNSMTSLLNRQTFFATEGQTSFTPSQKYRIGYVDVYYNGLKLNIPEDVTANDGSNIVFIGLTPTLNDVIEVIGLTPNVALANAIPITGGTISGGLTLAGNVLPSSTNTYYLGSATNRWHSIFVGPGSVDIGGLKLSNVAGTLSVSSPGSPAVPIAGEDNWVRAQANASFVKANSAFNAANSAFNAANSAFNAANSVNVYGANTTSNSFFSIPIGTTAERPAAAANGVMRYNTTLGRIEAYMPTAGWQNILSDALVVEYLVVAGGGGGGRQHGGGGGGGGYRSSVAGESSGGGSSAESTLSLVPGTYVVTVGGGGAGSSTQSGGTYTGVRGANGSSSVFHSITSIGGGGAGSYRGSVSVDSNGNSGGSGGGAGSTEGVGPGAGNYGGAGEVSQGYPGGRSSYAGAGGGGAGGIGGNGAGSTPGGIGGTGGSGVTSAITGTSVSRAGGGGGGIYGSGNGSTGTIGYGTDGGANGGTGTQNGNDAVSNRGGGGGGGGAWEYYGGAGGSGIVIVRYQGSQRATGGTVTSAGGYTIHTFTGSGSFIV